MDFAFGGGLAALSLSCCYYNALGALLARLSSSCRSEKDSLRAGELTVRGVVVLRACCRMLGNTAFSAKRLDRCYTAHTIRRGPLAGVSGVDQVPVMSIVGGEAAWEVGVEFFYTAVAEAHQKILRGLVL